MSAELQTAADIKYIDIRMKKKPKNNSAIIYIIKDAGELFVKVLLFLLCCENPEKIDFEFMKHSVKSKNAENGEILEALDFWKDRDILSYEITSETNTKGLNIENVINIMLNVRRDINILNGKEEPEEIEYQQGLGIYEEKITEVKTEDKPAAKAEPVSVDQVCESLETNEEFKRLIHEIQNQMKLILNTAEYVIMYNLHETNGMEVNLILELSRICAEEGKNNIRYLEKVALGMLSEGILKLSQYEGKIEEMQKIKEFEEKIKIIFEAETKKLTSKERNYIKKWAKEYNFTDDMLSEGYKQCLKYTERLSFEYINTIYSNWHEKGFATLDDIKNEFASNGGNSKKNDSKKNAGYNVEQFFEKLVKNL
ncbi:MAG: DnaD domain protein [Oscillospiraceae bacterium]|nr:DnaD domain protein [Oscillospiraceae bacterium]